MAISTKPPMFLETYSSWIERLNTNNKLGLDINGTPLTDLNLLPPQPASTLIASTSDETCSAESARTNCRASIHNMIDRIRSKSTAITTSSKSEDSILSEINNWFDGFRLYNRIISAEAVGEQVAKWAELAIVKRALTKSCGGQFINGLPEAAFDLSLLWCPVEN
ncbi:hypothetical protein J1614_010292 [Plenodomus biglobosus]|nr:hypothetical protein J1614_010292 [Plenodomus biglobosus]